MALSLFDALEFLQEQARQLILLNMATVAKETNIAHIQKQAEQSWNRAQGNWHGLRHRYFMQKRKYVPRADYGVLTGAWKEYRTLRRADIVFKQKKGKPILQVVAREPTQRQTTGPGAKVEGLKNAAKKPWVNYPKRRVLDPDNYFSLEDAAILPPCRGDNLKVLLRQLPLKPGQQRKMMKKGVVLARIAGGKVHPATAFRKALK